MTYSMEDVATLLGHRKPARAKHAARVCVECGADDEWQWADEITHLTPNGTGYVVLMCGQCGTVAEETRYWMGH